MPARVDALSHLLDDILDDLSARFIINLPEEELSSVTRICFGLEQAHWFYEDFFRPQHPNLPSVNLRAFTAALFSHCPLLWKFSGQHEAAFDDFLKYKIRVPVRGAIMLNEDLTKCVLVKGWKASAGWGFPKGKIDQQEADHDCAVREVREECGFDISTHIKKDEFIDVVMKEQSVRLYVVAGVPLDTKFEPQTRKEISKIDWFHLNDLPTYKKNANEDAASSAKLGKFYMVAPFLGPLRRWIKQHRPGKARKQKDAAPAQSAIVSQEVKANDEEVSQDIAGDNDAPSQALKLLLGITDVPASMSNSEKEQPPLDNIEKDGGIDLASLFTKNKSLSASIVPRQTRPLSSETVPMKLLNTSIEASILDQLRPAGQTGQSGTAQTRHVSDQDRVNTRHSPQIPLQALPPWMQQQFPPSPLQHHVTQISNLPGPPMLSDQFIPHGYPNGHMPMPPPNLHMLQAEAQNRPLAQGPPGLSNTSIGDANARKVNPNASSLLALLRPSTDQQQRPGQHHNTINNQMYQSNMQGAPPNSLTHAPIAHKQSLLALLRPENDHQAISQNHQQVMHDHRSVSMPNPTSTTYSMNHSTGKQSSDKDAFLLDYLTRAANATRIQ